MKENRFKSPREELDFLTMKSLSARSARRSSVAVPDTGKAAIAELKKIGDAVVSAVESLADSPKPVVKVPESIALPVRRWVFKHKYDAGKLVETTATAE